VSEALTIQLDAPIHRVAVLGAERQGDPSAPGAGRQIAQKMDQFDRRAEELEREFASRKARLEQTAQALHAVGDELAKLRKQMIEEMRSEAVHLAMDVARKVLHQEIESKEYQIDPIVTEALSRLPQRGEITVRLHPDDFERCSLKEEQSNEDKNVRFTADPNVPPAGCVVTSVEGCVETGPEASLEQIDAALKENQS
jgi:flagellar biosynthesis/type III secretory pathway protein FliH